MTVKTASDSILKIIFKPQQLIIFFYIIKKGMTIVLLAQSGYPQLVNEQNAG